MNDDQLSVTSVSLLAQLRVNDRSPGAWRSFVDRYGPRMFDWCLNRGLQPADAEDVTQEVLVKLAQRMGTFSYDSNQTFRGWLRRVTENAIVDFLRERKRKEKVGSGTTSADVLKSVEQRQDLTSRLEEVFDLELLEIARQRVKGRIEPKRWRAWEMTSVERQSGDIVSKELGIKLPTVYSSRYQVQKMISAELQTLEEESAVYTQEQIARR